MTTKFYANRSNARRAAKAAGLDLDTLVFSQVLDGTWTWAAAAPEPVAPKAPRYRLHRKPKAKPKAKPVVAATPVAAAPAPGTTPAAAGTAPKHKDFSVYGRSQVLSPVQFVKQFLDAKGKGLTRKEALYELAQHGVNYATARTQYQRWFTANK